jgi:hypothetical protein
MLKIFKSSGQIKKECIYIKVNYINNTYQFSTIRSSRKYDTESAVKTYPDCLLEIALQKYLDYLSEPFRIEQSPTDFYFQGKVVLTTPFTK